MASSIGTLVEEGELLWSVAPFLRRLGGRVPRRCPMSIRLIVNVHVGAQRDDHPTPRATGPRRPHQAATGSAAPSTTKLAPQAAPATRGMVSTRTSAPV